MASQGFDMMACCDCKSVFLPDAECACICHAPAGDADLAELAVVLADEVEENKKDVDVKESSG